MDPEFRRLVKAWLYYHVTTERYDRTKNGYWIRPDVFMPIGWGGYEARRFARFMREKMKNELTGERSQAANEYVLKHPFTEQEKMLEQMTKEDVNDERDRQEVWANHVRRG